MCAYLVESVILQASNAMVRANAACLLFDNFPLVNSSDEGSSDQDAYLQKQFTAIDDLVEDSYPQVRSIGKSACRNHLNFTV